MSGWRWLGRRLVVGAGRILDGGWVARFTRGCWCWGHSGQVIEDAA